MTCPNCAEGFVLPGEPTGSFPPDYEGAYYAPAPLGESKRAVILLTDGFGLELNNPKILADKLSQSFPIGWVVTCGFLTTSRVSRVNLP